MTKLKKKRKNSGANSKEIARTQEEASDLPSDSKSSAPKSIATSILHETAAEDPIASFIQKRWREFAILIALVFAFVYGQRAFESTRRVAQQRSADVFLQLQEEVQNFHNAKATLQSGASNDTASSDQQGQVDGGEGAQNTDELKADELKERTNAEKTIADSQQKIGDLIKVLEQERSPYKELSSIYKNITNSTGSGADISAGTISSTKSSLVTELGILSQAVKNLQNIDSDKTSAFNSLEQLVQKSKFVNVPALVLLVQSGGRSTSDAKSLASDLVSRHPEQGDLLRQNLPELF